VKTSAILSFRSLTWCRHLGRMGYTPSLVILRASRVSSKALRFAFFFRASRGRDTPWEQCFFLWAFRVSPQPGCGIFECVIIGISGVGRGFFKRHAGLAPCLEAGWRSVGLSASCLDFLFFFFSSFVFFVGRLVLRSSWTSTNRSPFSYLKKVGGRPRIPSGQLGIFKATLSRRCAACKGWFFLWVFWEGRW